MWHVGHELASGSDGTSKAGLFAKLNTVGNVHVARNRFGGLSTTGRSFHSLSCVRGALRSAMWRKRRI